ncbi:MAG: metallophosphoesterase [Clostridia bacterium]|nr:metallophosphoesterase [Clostridia bacterium]
MLRVGILSDSHGNLTKAQLAVDKMGKIDFLLHAGDFARDAYKLNLPLETVIYAVRGNCDRYSDYEDELLITLGSFKVILTHGDAYGVKYDWLGVLERAKAEKAQAVIFGHTHIPQCRWESGILLFNPGSIAAPRDGGSCSYGVWELNRQGEIYPEIYGLT